MDRAIYGKDRTMNVIERGARSFDAFQQRNRALSLIYAVMKKFGDDNGGILVGSLTQTAFGAMFPLLLLLVTILGLVLSSHPALRQSVLHSTLSEFPIIGNDLASNIKALHRNSVAGLVIGIVGLVWGSLGLAQNGIFTMAQVWNIPGPARPNYLKRLGRSVSFLAVLAVGLLLSTFLAAGAPTARGSLVLAVGGAVLSAVVNFGEYLFAFRVLTPAKVPLRQLVPGAVLAGVGWTVLQSLGGFVVGHYLKDDSAVYGLFGIVLGLFAWIYLIAELTVYAAELNVVLARKLWPRAMVQPPLTDADRRSMAAQALQNQRRPEQHVDVSFDDGQDDGGDEPAEKDRDHPSETVQSTPGAGPKA
jgi:YihY family inner membrane protein